MIKNLFYLLNINIIMCITILWRKDKFITIYYNLLLFIIQISIFKIIREMKHRWKIILSIQRYNMYKNVRYILDILYIFLYYFMHSFIYIKMII